MEPLPEKEETWKQGEKVERPVVQAFLFGAHGVGKSSLLRRFLGSSPAGKYLPDQSLKTAVNMVKHGEGSVDSFILTEVNEESEVEAFQNLRYCDLACLVWDVTRPDSLQYVMRLCARFPRGTKVLLVAMKSDLLRVVVLNGWSNAQKYESTAVFAECKEFCAKWGLEESLLTSMYAKDRLFPLMFECAMMP